MENTDKLLEALETIAEKFKYTLAKDLADEALPLARQLIEEVKELRLFRAAVEDIGMVPAVEYERLKKLTDHLRAGEVDIDEQEREYVDAQARLSAAEERIRIVVLLLRKNSEAWHYHFTRLRTGGIDYKEISPGHAGRWEECAEASCVKDRDAIRRWEEGK